MDFNKNYINLFVIQLKIIFMKKFNQFILLFMFIIAISGCQKDYLETKSVFSSGKSILSEQSMDLIRAVENLPNSVVQLGFKKLSPEEKFVFWTRHIDNFLKNNKLTLETENHIMNLKKFLRVDLFTNIGSEETKKQIDDFEKAWLIDPVASGKFDAKTLVFASSLMNVGKKDDVSKTAIASGEPICHCRLTIYCQIGDWHGTCDDGKCVVATDEEEGGCGLFGTSNCTGICNN